MASSFVQSVPQRWLGQEKTAGSTVGHAVSLRGFTVGSFQSLVAVPSHEFPSNYWTCLPWKGDRPRIQSSHLIIIILLPCILYILGKSGLSDVFLNYKIDFSDRKSLFWGGGVQIVI